MGFLVSVSVPLGLIGSLNLLGLGWGWGFETKGWARAWQFSSQPYMIYVHCIQEGFSLSTIYVHCTECSKKGGTLYSGSKCSFLTKIKLWEESLKFCGGQGTCPMSLYSKFQRPGWSGTLQPGQKLIWKNLPSKSLRFLAFFQRLGFYGHLEAFLGKVQAKFMEVPGGCPGASEHWSSKIFLNKTSFGGLEPPPLNAGQVSCLDLCATLDIYLAWFMSYMLKL